MSYRKAGVILFTFLFSILSGCIGTSDSTDPSERIEDANHVHVACYDDVLTNPDCNIDFSVGRGIEPMVSSILLLEFESNDYDGHNHEHFDEHTHASEPENHSIDYSPIPDFLFAKSAIETSGRSHAQAASDCSSQDLIGLENHDLENYLVTHTQGCLFQSIVIPLDFNVVSVFTDENIVWMANRIEEIAPIYDGDNSEGIFQLMYFIHEAYYHEWYGQIDEFEMGTTNAVYDAINAIKTSPHLLNPGEASRQILNKLITMSDTVDGQALLLSIYAQILDEFPDDSSFYFIYANGVPSFTQQAVFSVLYSLQRSAHYTDVNAHPQIWDVLTLIAGISTDESITNDAEYIVSNAIWAFGRFAYTTPPYSEIYWWVSVNDMYDQACEYLIEAINFHYVGGAYTLPFLWAINTHDSFYTVPHPDRCVNDVVDLTLDEAIIEVENQQFPNEFSFDDGRIVIKTPLDEDEVVSLYYSTKEVQSQYYRLTECSLPVEDDPNSDVIFRIYGSKEAYVTWQSFLYNLPSDNGGIYIEQWGTIFTYQRTPDESIYTLDELVRHEYVHYLDGRYLIEEMWSENDFYDGSRLTWFNEGMAEFLVGSSNRYGIQPRETIIEKIQDDGTNRMTVSEIMASSYSSGFKFYRYSAVLIDFMYHEHNFQLRTLLECVDLDDSQCFDLITDSIANDAQFEDEYQAHIDEMISQLSTYDNPVPNFATDDQLNELETEYIENDFNQSTANEFTVQCDVSVRSMLPRYRCIGSLFQNETEDATTENSWHFFNRKLDLVIGDIYSSSNERYSEGMVCWFDRILIEQTIRNRYNHSTSFHCEIPLRVAQYSSDGILTQLEQDVARTRANDSIECSPPSPQNSVVYRCKIKVFSAWFESGTENDVLLSSLHMYSREISNQIHSSNPHVYAQSSCLVSSESLEYHEIDAEGIRYASAFMNCQYMM